MPALPLTIRRGSFLLLLLAMLAELALAPVLGMLPDGLPVARALTVLVLVAALLVAGLARLDVALFLATVAAELLALLSGAAPLHVLAATLRLAFLCRVLALLIQGVLTQRSVTFDTVAGAACAYVMLGVVWGALYLIVELLQPGAFQVAEAWKVGPARDLRAALNVFSMLNLATLGSDAVRPATPAMGALCAAEAIVGQLYLAVMIARMVGLHTAQRAG